jgi:hypothetical protein
MFSSIISSYGNSFLFLFSEIMDYEESEISKDAPKEKKKTQEIPPKNILQMVWQFQDKFKLCYKWLDNILLYGC